MDRRRALTLTEVLAVMVMATLALGLLAPAMGRARDAADVTQCRENLRIVGAAMAMYAADNGGWTPPAYGTWVGSHNHMTVNVNHRTEGGDLVTPQLYMVRKTRYHRDAGEGPDWGSNDHTLPLPAWPQGPGGGGIPSGLGLLFASRYLDDPRALNCPSREVIPKNGNGEPAEQAAKDDDALTKVYEWKTRLNQMMRFDPREPFWTTNGTAHWTNDDFLGAFNFSGPAGRRGTEPGPLGHYGWLGYRATFDFGAGGRSNAHHQWAGWPADCVAGKMRCNLLGSYMVRPENVADDYALNTHRLERMSRRAIASDAIWGFFGRSMACWPSQWPDNFDTRKWYYSYYRIASLSPDWWAANHATGYNVLFGDGSVKTFENVNEDIYARVCGALRKELVTLVDLAAIYQDCFDP